MAPMHPDTTSAANLRTQDSKGESLDRQLSSEALLTFISVFYKSAWGANAKMMSYYMVYGYE